MARVTATLVVNFSAQESGAAGNGLVLEIADRDDGLNGCNASFRTGDAAYYLLYAADSVTVQQHEVTAGSKTGAGSGYREVDEVVQFVDGKEGSLRYPASSAVIMTWIGSYHRTDGQNGPVSKQVIGPQTVRLGAPVAGLLRCVYRAAYSAYKLANVPTDIEPALVYVQGEGI